MVTADVQFAGTIPAIYDGCLGAVIFAPYADDLAQRVSHRRKGDRLLEIACGTGVFTRKLDALLPPKVRIQATDLNQAMIDYARARTGPSRRIEWKQADAAALPFQAAEFDAVACQFGLMFVPDKEAAFREARRVLRDGGTFDFNVWCRIEENAFAQRAHTTIASFFKSSPPTFYQLPFGFHDEAVIRGHLARAGFVDVACDRVALEARSPSARDFARGLVEGNPVSNAIREAGLPFPKIIDAVAAALIEEGGDHPFRSNMHALIVSARAN